MTRLDTRQKIEIAEGVEIDLRPAGLIVRVSAYMLDWLFKIGIILVASIVASSVGLIAGAAGGEEVGNGVASGIVGLVTFVLHWIYSICFEVSRWGATPGKRIMGLRVTQLSGAPVSLGQSVVRNMLRVVDLLPLGGAVGVISCLTTKRFQRLGDLAADTVVVYAPTIEPTAPPATAIESAEGEWVLRPPSRLTREEQVAVLTFSERSEEWTVPRREELASHAHGMLTAKTRP